ncbi:MAG: ATP-binding protein [Ruminococcus sp.]|nr:ATP-binding protein [Ruminococcus sp.]
MYKDYLSAMPEMKSGEVLNAALSVIPAYDDSICNKDIPARLMALSDLYRLYIPSQMSLEIYSKLYLALLRSMQKKGTNTAIKQHYENHKGIIGQEYNGIVGGSDSFTIIGCSGIGKSSAISRAITLISENRIIEIEKPYAKVIPCLIVQCPFDSSVKGLLLEILRKADEVLETNYYNYYIKSRASTTDMLIGLVSSIALNHIGILIVDEIQNVVNSKNGKNLVGMLTQLINNSGISICMVGTPECTVFFEQAMQLARRSVGLQYNSLCYDEYFETLCETVFNYQYVIHKTGISPAIIKWLYDHSGGVVSVVVSLIHDAQEIAILTGKEELSIETLNMAYKQRLNLLHSYIYTTDIKSKTTKPRKRNPATNRDDIKIGIINNVSIVEIAKKAKAKNIDIVSLLRNYFAVEEVCL